MLKKFDVTNVAKFLTLQITAFVTIGSKQISGNTFSAAKAFSSKSKSHNISFFFKKKKV